jgi:hypothetical protein
MDGGSVDLLFLISIHHQKNGWRRPRLAKLHIGASQKAAQHGCIHPVSSEQHAIHDPLSQPGDEEFRIRASAMSVT